MEVLSVCQANDDWTGAMWVTFGFLAVFALLLAGDSYLTWRALDGAMQRDTAEAKAKRAVLEQLDGDVRRQTKELDRLNARIRVSLSSSSSSVGGSERRDSLRM